MKLRIHRVLTSTFLVTLAILTALIGACVPAPKTGGNQPPVISSLEVEYERVYPRAASNVKCNASDPDGDEVQFRWSCTGGNLSGTGSVVTWESPNDYGEYYVMVIVNDDKGGNTTGTVSLSVVARPVEENCCGNK